MHSYVLQHYLRASVCKHKGDLGLVIGAVNVVYNNRNLKTLAKLNKASNCLDLDRER